MALLPITNYGSIVGIDLLSMIICDGLLLARSYMGIALQIIGLDHRWVFCRAPAVDIVIFLRLARILLVLKVSID